MAHIGLDLDNTIIDYDAAFPLVGEAVGILTPGHGLASKGAVKAHLLARDGGLETWMRLQGQTYGPRIGAAVPFAGAASFIADMLARGHQISIVSHKTRYGHFDETRTCLWGAARDWLRAHEFLSEAPPGLHEQDVIFNETREEKLRQIAELSCDIFVDDLLSVLLHPEFPEGTKRVWFAGREADDGSSGLAPHRSWAEIARTVEHYLKEPRT